MPQQQSSRRWSGRFRGPLKRAALFQYGLLALAVTGCHEKPDIDWSTQAYSSDKHWLVTAQREAGGSFGGGYAATTIYLKQADQQPLEIVGIDRLLHKTDLHLNWLGLRHLRIVIDAGSYPIQPSEVFFQAIKCGDVTIDLQTSPHNDPSPAQER